MDPSKSWCFDVDEILSTSIQENTPNESHNLDQIVRRNNLKLSKHDRQLRSRTIAGLPSMNNDLHREYKRLQSICLPLEEEPSEYFSCTSVTDLANSLERLNIKRYEAPDCDREHPLRKTKSHRSLTLKLSNSFKRFGSNSQINALPKPNKLKRSQSLNITSVAKNEDTENLKQKFLRKKEQWRERRQSSKTLKVPRKESKESKESKDDKEVAKECESPDSNKLYRWFSLRKSVNYDVEKRSSHHSDKPCSSYTLTNGTPPPSAASSTSSLSSGAHQMFQLHPHHKMPQLLEEGCDVDEGILSGGGVSFHRRHQPPALPPMPQGLTPEQIKRRHIITSIVHSENNYVATLQRLVNNYRKPLEESKPPILSSGKLQILFYRLTEILQCHTLFRIALTECVRQWDKEEKIGDVFVASFSKAIVLDVYSDFINNFNRAMEVAKQESKKKSAFADFLKMRQITSSDRLSFFGLMVKPIQRFPQFILFLQDLLKHTPQGHADRMSLQLALTQLESLAEMLNERKREVEQYQAFRDTLKHINTKFALRNISDGNRYLLRQDDVTQLEFGTNGTITKSKGRRLFLTNDLMICVSVVPKQNDEFSQNSERLSLKWAHPVTDVEIQDTSSSPTLSRLLAAGMSKSGTVNTSRIPEESSGVGAVDSLCQEMNNLMHDYEVVSRISSLVSSLKGEYHELNVQSVQSVASTIQRALHQRDEQMAWLDACCLQFCVKAKDGKEKEILTFQTTNPVVKKDWIVELRLAQLALDPANSPSWDLPEQEKRPSTKMPLFVKSLPVFASQHETEVKCGCCYTVTHQKPVRSSGRHQMYLWLCSSDGVSSHITVYVMQQVGLRELVRVDLTEVYVTALQYVPALGSSSSSSSEDLPLRSHTVWMGTHSHRLMVYSGLEPERQSQLGTTNVPAAVNTIKYHCDQVFVGLNNGFVQVYRRGPDGAWLLREPVVITLENHPINALLPISTHVYASCGDKVHVIDCFTADVTKEFGIHHENCGEVQLMAHSGIGLWIAQHQSSTICLYHTETFRHLQDINVASNVKRVLSETNHASGPVAIYVTALVASKGLLWVGTNVGVALTIPLPRLEGVPMISGRANISFHAHLGPITFLHALQPHGRPCVPAASLTHLNVPNDFQDLSSDNQSTGSNPSAKLEKQQSDGSLINRRIPPRLKQQLSSPVILRRKARDGKDYSRRLSKTLPRGVGLGGIPFTGSQEYDIYGLCGDLLNVRDYDDEPLVSGESSLSTISRYDSMRRSDPELALPTQVSTLDRRLRLKASRPRSLDLSTWSMESRASSACTTVSSGSEEGSGTSVGLNNNGCSSPSLNVVTNNSNNNMTGTNNRSTLSNRRKDLDQPRTLMVVTGGRGYINWRKPPDQNNSQPNSKDAHIIIWEMKL